MYRNFENTIKEDFFYYFKTMFNTQTKRKSMHVATEQRRIKYNLQIYICDSYLCYLFI